MGKLGTPAAHPPLTRFLAGRTEQYEVEFRMRHKEGRWVHILSRAIVVRDAAGQPVRLVGTHVDITGRRQTEARPALQGSRWAAWTPESLRMPASSAAPRFSSRGRMA